MAKKRAVVTISALNYGGRVAVLSKSFQKENADIPFFYFVLDYDFQENPSKLKRPEANCIALKDLDLFCKSQSPNFSLMNMLFPYDIMEASTAVKPFVLSMMFEKYGFDEVLFLDPDIAVYDRLDSIWEHFDDANILLTPHLIKLSRLDLSLASERSILKSGTYNLGFLGLKCSDVVTSFLKWWGQRLVRHCTREAHLGLFTDQKWVDILAGAEASVRVLRDPGLNVAHWNIHERAITKDAKGKYIVNGVPLKFFHFSGYNLDQAENLTKYIPHLKIENLGVGEELVRDYDKALQENNTRQLESFRYGLDFFSNGIPIGQYLKKWARVEGRLDPFKNVFDVYEENSFFNSLFKSSPNKLCLFAEILLNDRDDLKINFSKNSPNDIYRFMEWIVKTGIKDYRLDPKTSRILTQKFSGMVNPYGT